MNRFRILTLIAALIAAAPPAAAQDRQGNNRPSDWLITHFFVSGIWESMCDERIEDGALRQRCYIRRVDVFSPRPEFAAQFVFITPEPGGLRVEFGVESGTLFDPDGFRIETGDAVSWSTRRGGCLTGLACVFETGDSPPLIKAMSAGGDFRFTFIDRHGNPRDLIWPLDGFGKALSDFRAQSAARGLL